jgi:hypothetical protein
MAKTPRTPRTKRGKKLPVRAKAQTPPTPHQRQATEAANEARSKALRGTGRSSKKP